ncbi:hypothetical protein FZC75_08350 [Sutcliffiella horikoshii]|uniref:SGNH hydrolase-type esterase domain-containing protein n=1 Tax=Sutcliffiella horikoshii TaxID=79883 RepID=A0A5D4TBS3_9BACI|nr:hypothetical protein FZC75_08350 [Sutcliffiella horikoshii]
MLKCKHLSLLFAVLLVFNLFASNYVFAEEIKETEPTLVALGDSIPYGTNLPDRSQAFPNLILDGDTTVINKSTPGQTSTQLLAQVTTDPETGQALQNADVITINTGNNDLLQAAKIAEIAAAIQAGKEIDYETLEKEVAVAALKAGENLAVILHTIREINPDAPILLYNIFNPFPGLEAEPVKTLHQVGEMILKDVNKGFPLVASSFSNAFVLDAYSAFDGNQAKLVNAFPDVHPNSEGHKVLASLADNLLLGLYPPTEPEPEYELNLSLTPEDLTDGPVEIHVDTKGKTPLKVMWMAGAKTELDFLKVEDVNFLEGNSFEVTENGTYTVLAIFSEDSMSRAIQMIEVSNIVPLMENPTYELDLSISPNEDTEGPVTISIDTKDQTPISLMWMKGEKIDLDFLNIEDVNFLQGTSFEVSENGKYTVLAVFSQDGMARALKTIEVTNIVSAVEPPIEEPPVEEEGNTPPPPVKKDETKQPVEKKQVAKSGNKLPNTATSAYNYLVWGAGLLFVGLVSITSIFVYRRKFAV